MCSSYGPPSKLFVGDLGDNRKSDLARLFSKYGEITTIYVDEHKHFAFIEFTSPVDAQRALERTHNKILNGSKLRVEYAKVDKVSRDSRRPVSREQSPTSVLYSHLQVTANRLPPLKVFRQKYHTQLSAPITRNGSGTSRGRSLTPPSFKQNSYLSAMYSLRPPDFYYYHPAMYNDPVYYRTYGDPYLMQRLLPPPSFLPSASSPPPSSSRIYQNMYPSFGTDRYISMNSPPRHQHRRSRSRHRASSPLRSQGNRERKNKRQSSSSTSSTERGPRTPPSKSSARSSKERSHSRSDSDSTRSSDRSPSHLSSEESNDEVQRSSVKRSADDVTDPKHSKSRKRE